MPEPRQKPEGLARDLLSAQFECKICPSLASIRWKKLAIIIPLGLTVILDATANDLVTNNGTYRLLGKLCAEVINTAKKCGVDLPNNLYQFCLDVFDKLPTSPSIKIDYDMKRPLEIHSIYQAAFQIAKKHGSQMILSEVICDQLIFLDQANRKNI